MNLTFIVSLYSLAFGEEISYLKGSDIARVEIIT